MKNTLLPFVSFVANFVTFLGLIFFVIGLILAGSIGFEYLKAITTTGARWVWSPEDLIGLGVGSQLILIGMLFALSAGAVKLLSAIEKNTRPQNTQ